MILWRLKLKSACFLARLLNRMGLSLSRGPAGKPEKKTPMSWSRGHAAAVSALSADGWLCGGFWHQLPQRSDRPPSESMGTGGWGPDPMCWLRAHGKGWYLGSSGCGVRSKAPLCPDHGRSWQLCKPSVGILEAQYRICFPSPSSYWTVTNIPWQVKNHSKMLVFFSLKSLLSVWIY